MELTRVIHRSEFGEASEVTSAKCESAVFGETSERVRKSFGVSSEKLRSALLGFHKILHS
ncbi:MAG: hypothetical protein MJE68_07600 [Proteobacteria bacterium]|nr:hypothetical protein [Pseudomonadota bacterium]